jgi:hypothetical protein
VDKFTLVFRVLNDRTWALTTPEFYNWLEETANAEGMSNPSCCFSTPKMEFEVGQVSSALRIKLMDMSKKHDRVFSWQYLKALVNCFREIGEVGYQMDYTPWRLAHDLMPYVGFRVELDFDLVRV